ncbi:MAG: pyridoxine 4-dehydrogenase, partial [Frankiaceae bacterium]|nr:pyridoxine 4-dehydrogenase [Frankiaceae bacterium]
MTANENMTVDLVGRPVHRVGFGAMQLPGPGVFGPPRDRDAALAVLRRAVELGVNHVDTAQYYGPDVSNELIRTALHPYPDDLVLVSKVGALRDDAGNWIPAQRPEELRAGVEANLASLAVERVDVVNLRRMEAGHAVPAEQQVSFDDQAAAMTALRDEGLIGGVGLSNVSAEELQAALDGGLDVACVQNPYNVLFRDDEPTLRLCAERGIPYVPFFPLGSAFEHMPKVTEHPTVIAAAQQTGMSAVQVGLAWLLARDASVLLIPGTSSVEHLEENCGAGAVTLPED